MREISLGHGQVALVDDSDYAWISGWNWRAQKHGKTGMWCAKRTDRTGGAKKSIYMHRQLMCAPTGLDVSHKDGNPLHNWRDNLRLAGRNQGSRRSGRTLAETFEIYTIPEPNSGCLLWIGPVLSGGYGLCWIGRHPYLAHRISFKLAYGYLPDELCILHSCDVPPCVNPRHLRAGTHMDNAADRDSRGRGARGVRQPKARLSEKDVLSIFASDETCRALANRFGVGPTAISDIRRGHTWNHLTGRLVGDVNAS